MRVSSRAKEARCSLVVSDTLLEASKIMLRCAIRRFEGQTRHNSPSPRLLRVIGKNISRLHLDISLRPQRTHLFSSTHLPVHLGLEDDNLSHGASSTCGACKSNTSSRQYCGKACQVKDWPAHKKACKDIQNVSLEKRLARVADIVQQAYYDFRENTWDTPIIKIDDRDDALVIYDDDMLKKSKFFLTFPHHLVTNDLTKKAMLCTWVCNEPMAWMHNTFLSLLEGKTISICIQFEYANSIPIGLNIEVEEVSVSLGTIPRKITIRNPFGGGDDNWPEYKHDVIRITSIKTKKKWVIDISGAQYSIYQAFRSWEEYENKYLASTKEVHAVGTNKALLKHVAKISGNPYLCYGLVGIVADHLDEAVNNWRMDNGISLTSLLDLDDKDYEEASSKLLRTLDDSVRTYVETHDYNEKFKAAKAYERKYPLRSARTCDEVTKSFFSQIASVMIG
jgi:hypothetical protein